MKHMRKFIRCDEISKTVVLFSGLNEHLNISLGLKINSHMNMIFKWCERKCFEKEKWHFLESICMFEKLDII
jgi:hypothetical protein